MSRITSEFWIWYNVIFYKKDFGPGLFPCMTSHFLSSTCRVKVLITYLSISVILMYLPDVVIHNNWLKLIYNLQRNSAFLVSFRILKHGGSLPNQNNSVTESKTKSQLIIRDNGKHLCQFLYRTDLEYQTQERLFTVFIN